MTRRLLVSIAAALAVAVASYSLLRPGDEENDLPADSGQVVATAAWSDVGRQVFAAMGCGSCHRLAAAGSAGGHAPSLDEVLPGYDHESLARAIVDPPGFMPDDFGERMTDSELDALVSFLLSTR